jgi:hypothetical protein
MEGMRRMGVGGRVLGRRGGGGGRGSWIRGAGGRRMVFTIQNRRFGPSRE